MKVKDRDYVGKKVFVGMDIHKKTYVTAAYCDGSAKRMIGRTRTCQAKITKASSTYHILVAV